MAINKMNGVAITTSTKITGASRAKILGIDIDAGSTTNLYTFANAANPDSEVNATTGVNANANFAVTSVSTAPTAQNGTYSLKFTRSGTNGSTYYSFIYLEGLEVGATYEISLWFNRVNGGTFRVETPDFYDWTTTYQSPLLTIADYTVDTWYNLTWTAIPTDPEPVIRVAANSNTLVDHAIAIDNIVITKIADAP